MSSGNEWYYYAAALVAESVENNSELFAVKRDEVQSRFPLIFKFMLEENLITKDSAFTLTDSGSKFLKRFLIHYGEFIHYLEVFSRFDLTEWEFAYSSYNDFMPGREKSWNNFLQEERWDDLRIAMAQNLNLNMQEIMFFTLYHEGYFNQSEKQSESYLIKGLKKDLESMLSRKIKLEDLSYEDEEGEEVSWTLVVEDLSDQSADLLDSLYKSGLTFDLPHGGENRAYPLPKIHGNYRKVFRKPNMILNLNWMDL